MEEIKDHDLCDPHVVQHGQRKQRAVQLHSINPIGGILSCFERRWEDDNALKVAIKEI